MTLGMSIHQVHDNAQERAVARQLLVQIASGLHRSGVPTGDLEHQLERLALAMDLDAQIQLVPTSLVVAWSDCEAPPVMMRLPLGGLDLHARERWSALVKQIEGRQITLAQAQERVRQLQAHAPRYRPTLVLWGHVLSGASSAVLFGGSLEDMTTAGLLGAVVGLGLRLLSRRSGPSLWIEAVMAALVTVISVWLWNHGLAITPGLVVLSSLVTLLPGYSLTIALQELGSGHMVSGSARLATVATTLVALGCGVALGGVVGATGQVAPQIASAPLPAWSHALALPVAAGSFLLLLQLRGRRFWALTCVAALSTAVSHWGAAHYGPVVAAFLAALTLGLSCAIIEKLGQHPAPSLLVPSLFLLVPGSVGFRGVQAWLARDVMAGSMGFFEMAMGATALAVGLWVAQWLAQGPALSQEQPSYSE
jgi:uncharacterized membrane protein YjjP (DUF1212 family)